MKHKFKAGDGMSKKTSTPEQRKEIYQLLEDNGYSVLVKTKQRDKQEFSKPIYFNEYNFGLTYLHAITNDYTYQEMKDLILGKEEEETITVNRSELINAIRKEFNSPEVYSHLIFSRVKEVQCKLPTIELKGANKEINYISRDSLTTSVYGYTNRPEATNAGWSDEKSCFSLEGLDQSQFESIKSMDWKESLHKVKHI